MFFGGAAFVGEGKPHMQAWIGALKDRRQNAKAAIDRVYPSLVMKSLTP
jgi:hypothetical protein